jgi:rRNA maturation endonuclease Nob1
MKPGDHPNFAISFSELGDLESDPDLDFAAIDERRELDALESRERFIRLALKGGYRRQEIADALGVSRFTLRREINRFSRPIRHCKGCGRPLPRGSTARKEFCDKSTCRVRAWRA